MLRSVMIWKLIDNAPLHPVGSGRCVALLFVGWAAAIALRAVRQCG